MKKIKSNKIKSNKIKMYVTFTKNNTMVICKRDDKLLFKVTAGMVGYKGKQKRSWLANYSVGTLVSTRLQKLKIKRLTLLLKGDVRRRKKSFVRSFIHNNIKIKRYVNTTNAPHNGCKKKKVKRK